MTCLIQEKKEIHECFEGSMLALQVCSDSFAFTHAHTHARTHAHTHKHTQHAHTAHSTHLMATMAPTAAARHDASASLLAARASCCSSASPPGDDVKVSNISLVARVRVSAERREYRRVAQSAQCYYGERWAMGVLKGRTSASLPVPRMHTGPMYSSVGDFPLWRGNPFFESILYLRGKC